MSGRITNNSYQYQLELKARFISPFNSDTRIIYSVFPAFYEGNYSLQLIDEDEPYILVRKWKQDISNSSHLGIYKPDDISFEETQINISKEQRDKLLEIAERKLIANGLETVMLDGVTFDLIIYGKENQKLTWQLPEQLNNQALKLTNQLEELVFAHLES